MLFNFMIQNVHRICEIEAIYFLKSTDYCKSIETNMAFSYNIATRRWCFDAGRNNH